MEYIPHFLLHTSGMHKNALFIATKRRSLWEQIRAEPRSRRDRRLVEEIAMGIMHAGGIQQAGQLSFCNTMYLSPNTDD